jgi:hypothetical protein
MALANKMTGTAHIQNPEASFRLRQSTFVAQGTPRKAETIRKLLVDSTPHLF